MLSRHRLGRVSSCATLVVTSRVQDVAGDALFFSTVQRYRLKDWVNRMIIPYTEFFAVGCAVSLVSVSTKVHMIFVKLRARTAQTAHEKRRRASLGGMPISPHHAGNPSVKELKRKLEDLKVESRRNYCHLLVAVFGASLTVAPSRST